MTSTRPTPRPIRRLLVANRGEIALRVLRTAELLGIQTVAVSSEADADAPFARAADRVVVLPGVSATQTYLDIDAVVAAALVAGCDAVHPGYGFLSENAAFARAVQTAGLTWVGPPARAMESMGSKVQSKRLVAAAGVPLVPGAELPDTGLADETDPLQVAATVGYPLLVKASAGGGGKGMRSVAAPDELVEAVATARREAASSFGDPTVFLERHLDPVRHVEVQVFADMHGNIVHLFERECSIQRRHQKVLEESPSPGATPKTLQGMYAAAVAAARAVDYVGAGTVEFLVSGQGDAQEFFFLEMNTRLQVEHPVTELITGLDLVEWQLRVAAGESLPLQQDEIQRSGHAIEVRLYAEDPARGHQPATGPIHCFDLDTDRLAGVRLDSGVDAGSMVTPYYDPMLAKVSAAGPTRRVAAARLAAALRQLVLHGPVTNRGLLVALLADPEVLAGNTTTDLLDRRPELNGVVPAEVARAHLVAAAVGSAALADSGAGTAVPAGWRNVPAVPQWRAFGDPSSGATTCVLYGQGRDGIRVAIVDGSEPSFADLPDLVPAAGLGAACNPGDGRSGRVTTTVRYVENGVRVTARVHVHGDDVYVDDGWWSTGWTAMPRFAESGADAHAGGPATAVPGTVTAVLVEVGETVEAGQPLVLLEAMKMEHRIVAESAGEVARLFVAVGDAVDAHVVVAEVVSASDAPAPGSDGLSVHPAEQTTENPA